MYYKINKSRGGRFMKKFLSKMPVMIVFLSLALVGLVFYIVMLARPVSYGMTYSYSHVVTEEDAALFGEEVGTEINMDIKIKNDKKMEMTTFATSGETAECWLIRNGNKFVIIPEGTGNEEEYDTAVEGLKADEEAWNAVWNGEAGMPVFEVNAFGMKANLSGIDIDLTCTGAIVFASIWGVVEVALITFGVLSLVFFLKDRKSGATQSSESPAVEQ